MNSRNTESLNDLKISFVDDPRVVAQESADDYARHAVPITARTSKWRLTMAMWAVLSALFYLYISVAVVQAVGSRNAIIGISVSVVIYGVINYIFAKQAIKSGLTVGLLSRGLFGGLGATITTLLFAVTAIYFAVFEGSIIAVALQQYFSPGSNIEWWYLLVVVYALPLVVGGVQNWLDRLNGALLPLYYCGLIYVVYCAGSSYGFSTAFLSIPSSFETTIPGWLWAVVVYMGVFVNMMFTVDYARFGKPADQEFHGVVTFGPIFYVLLFIVNGIAGIFFMETVFPGVKASEHGIAEAILNAAGGLGLAFIIISQTRINTANYYLASVNLSGFAARAFGLRLPRLVWVIVAGILVYLLMLTNVFSYLLKALAWQGVAVTAWVAIALVHVVAKRSDRFGIEFRPGRVQSFTLGAWAWTLTTVCGIGLIELGDPKSWYVMSAPLLIGVAAALSYAGALVLRPNVTLHRSKDPRQEVTSIWEARIECHACGYSYVAVEMDCDPSSHQRAICAGCAEGNQEFLTAARKESIQNLLNSTRR